MTIGELARRVAVAIVGIPIVGVLVYLGALPLALLLAVLGGLGAWELFRMARHSGIEAMDVFGVAIAAGLPLYTALWASGALAAPAALAAVVLVTLLGASLWARGVEGRPLASVSVTAFGAVYTGGLLCFAWLLRNHRYAATAAAGTALVMYPVVLTWASDVGAYFAGRALGTTKLMPAISPGKTRAGAWGALVVTALVSVGYIRFVLEPRAQLSLSLGVAIGFGLLVSVVAQIGDLVESMLKREAKVKDSSHLLPGHGGVLDRLDSLYFVLPVAYLVLEQALKPVTR
ncbi:MAG: phosphatidate cytidylyltransferase [Gemmatimonadetes bacterium]|nr:phosphatidate cytidylyltransferase [Gemmatimonadota bacterium]